MLSFISKIFGTKSDKDIKVIMPIVEEINRVFEEFNSLTDDEIKAKTQEFKDYIKEQSRELEEEKTELQNRLKTEALDAHTSIEIRDRLKEIEKEIHVAVEAALNDILPQAFATIKQACQRMRDSDFTYEYMGQRSKWEMVPYDVQLIGGVVLHQGRISEMATGEGKTLVATMPMYLNALAGKGVHLVTVNDYLAKRDAQWMKPIYDYLGITVGSITSNMENDDRKRIYNCDITYGTNNEFGFDYLRDNMVIEYDHMVQREHWYAIVDEVDSVLIDEARTPLIISGPVGKFSDQKFDEMNPRVKRLVDAQSHLINKITQEATELLAKNTKEDNEQAGVLLLRASRGLPKHKRFQKLMQEPEYQTLKKTTELLYMRDHSNRMHEIDDELFYTIDEKNHQIDITDKGRDIITMAQEEPEMFIIPDIATEQSAIEGNETMPEAEKKLKVDELNRLYAERSDRIHTVSQLLRAYSLYEKDVEYVIQDNKVQIVDEFTGRILEGRRYSEGLHQAIEAKESVKVERDTQTMATITLQNYFRLYKKLAGMTGTAETEASEFEKIYKLDCVVIPTNRPVTRDDREDMIYKTRKEKYTAMINDIQTELKNGRAVLVGTTNVEVSELLSKMLKRMSVPHNVLNAKQHQKEAEIVAGAGKKGALTIATNMAGRGTDIKLDPDVKKNGGLAIIGSERHDARRIDRQLRGRSGRQGDPGSSQFYISLEDDLMRLFGGERIAGIMGRLKIPEGEPIQHSMITKSVERAQKKVEENNFGIRKRLIEYDDVMNHQRTVIYTRRKHALRGERLKGEIFEYVEELAYEWAEDAKESGNLGGLIDSCRSVLLCEPKITQKIFEDSKPDALVDIIIEAADEFYKRKEQTLGSEFMAQLEKVAVLQTIDDKWKEHLRTMDDMKEGIHLRAYGQKDPLLEYKQEAYKQFVELVSEINRESVNFAFRYFPKVVQREARTTDRSKDGVTQPFMVPALRGSGQDMGGLQFINNETPEFVRSSMPRIQQSEGGNVSTVRTVRRTEPRVGRNDPCPCGSGKKYKNCHGKSGMN